MRKNLSSASLPTALTVLAAALPSLAHAQTVAQAVGLFDILSGLMIVAAFLAMGGGFIVYLCRIGNVNREDGIKIMEWGVTIIFVLIVLLALVQLVRHFF